MNTKSLNPKTFQNPSGYWEHQGSFSVELTDDASTDIVPNSAEIHGQTVRVRYGRIKQTMGGIQLYSQEESFYWGYKFLKSIKDGDGNLLWINNNHR